MSKIKSDESLVSAAEKLVDLRIEFAAVAKELQTEFAEKLTNLRYYYVNLPDEMKMGIYDSEAAKDALKALTLKHLRLAVTPDEILAFIGDKKKSKKDIVKYFEFSTPIITKRLKEMVAANKLKTEGSKKTTVYLKA